MGVALGFLGFLGIFKRDLMGFLGVFEFLGTLTGFLEILWESWESLKDF